MCEIDKGSDTLKEVDEIAQKKVEEFSQEFLKHGIRCGQKIAKLTREMHPNAIAIVPLYRSCMVIEQNEEQEKEGIAVIHSYGDPHWLGKEITIENLKSDDFHFKFIVHGLREGLSI